MLTLIRLSSSVENALNISAHSCETVLHSDIACKPLEIVGAGMFLVNNKMFCVL